MGLPALQLVLADNQRGISGALAGGGAAITIDRYRLPEALAVSLANFAKNPERLITMSACAAAVTDGRGTEKVADILLSEFAG